MKYKHIRSINPFKCNQKYNLFSLHSLNFGFNCFPSNCSMVLLYIFYWSVINIHRYITFNRSVVYLLLFQEKQIIPTKAKTSNCKFMQCHVMKKYLLGAMNTVCEFWFWNYYFFIDAEGYQDSESHS